VTLAQKAKKTKKSKKSLCSFKMTV